MTALSILFGALWLPTASLIFEETEGCQTVALNSATEIGPASQNCITLPVYSADPLVIVMYEATGWRNNQFRIDLMTSDKPDAAVLESFLSEDVVTVGRSFSAAAMEKATLRIAPQSSDQLSYIRVHYQRVQGIDSLYVFNENFPLTPVPAPSSPCELDDESLCVEIAATLEDADQPGGIR